MAFNSFSFIFIFLPLFVFLQTIVKNMKVKNAFLFISFIIFYLWGSPKFIPLILIVSITTYIIAGLIEKHADKKSIIVVIYTAFLVGILAYYKYIDFAIRIVNGILNKQIQFLNLLLPLGISFFTFQSLAYVYDVAMKRIETDKDPLKVITYLTFFATITSGPILRYSQLKEELDLRTSDFNKIAEGLRMFIIGLGKKVIIANNVALIANLGFGDGHITLNWQVTWLAAIAFTLQIYFDFSGYSDMAIGVSKMLGFTKIPANFNYPYISTSIGEFWRRWHISLGSWFRDYIYIPLGGNRVSTPRWLINIFIVWGITGLWHGAATTFILWGLYFGVILVMEKFFINSLLKKLPRFVSHIYAILMIIFGWIIFNSTSRADLVFYLKNMFDFSFTYNLQDFKMLDVLYTAIIFGFGILASTPLIKIIIDKLERSKWNFIYDISLVLILILSVMMIINNSYSPFIYFNF